MSALSDAATSFCLWMAGATLWAGLVYCLVGRGAIARKHEAWAAYWIALIGVACAPPLLLPIVLMAPSPLPLLELEGAMATTDVSRSVVAGAAANSDMSWFQFVPVFGAACYLIAFIALLTGFLRNRAQLHALVASARPLVEFAPQTFARVAVAPCALSPFCVVAPQPTIVLPEHVLRTMSEDELQWIIGHETCHLKRRDPMLFDVLAVLTLLFCFNPFVRALTARLRLSAELACDTAVIARNPAARRAYARTLLRSLHRCEHHLAPAFGPTASESRIRIFNILNGQRWQPTRLSLAVLACLCLVAGGAGAAAAASASRTLTMTNPRFERAISGRITLGFGALTDAGKIHRGVDVAAPAGAPVLAPAPARVLFAGANYQGQPALGIVVVLRHANGWHSVFAHLQSAQVTAGAYVNTGKPIGLVGSTGRSSGPHVHVEMLRQDALADPGALGVTPISDRGESEPRHRQRFGRLR